MTTAALRVQGLTGRDRCHMILNAGDRTRLWTWLGSNRETDTYTVVIDGKTLDLTTKHVEDLAMFHFVLTQLGDTTPPLAITDEMH